MTANTGSRNNILLGLAFLVLLTLPIWMQHPYYINISSQILFWAIIALGLNVLVGYGGLTSLGHSGIFAVTAYTVALMVEAGYGHLAAAIAALVLTVAASAVFAVLALRATGIGFLMITLALGQIVWGIAYRWVGLTNGDNGVNLKVRPEPFGISLASPEAFYWATLLIFLVAMASMYLFVRSPFGATVRGTRDQPRRMNALGFNVWLIRFLAFLFSGFWCGVGGLLYIYYNQFVSPQVAALQTSAEVLLMVISGGTATLFGPIAGAAIVVIMKNVVSAWIERWNLVLGIVFVLIISFMPEGLVPGIGRLWRLARGTGAKPAAPEAEAKPAPAPAAEPQERRT
jgi:branched-chain amino acid transport system permease protein